MSVLLNERYGWTTKRVGSLDVHGRGDPGVTDGIAQRLLATANLDSDRAAEILRAAHGHFAVVIEGPDYLFAAVDHCRSIPVFFSERKDRVPAVSNDAHLLQAHVETNRVDDISALEAAMSGYVAGRRTLYEGLSQLQSGDLLWHDKQTGATSLRHYYIYWPGQLNAASEADLMDQLAAVTDDSMRRVVAQANGAPIWVPLSAGLDSRLILCKLVELGYDNLVSFSYGPGGNDEAKGARDVAQRLNVPWRFFPNRSRDMRRLYASPDRVSYWAFGDGLCTLPNLQDFPTLHRLRERNEIPQDAVIVNGQSGDFISGAHIPEALWNNAAPTLDDLFAAIVAKHYSLWQSLKTPTNLEAIKARVWSSIELRGDESPSRHQVVALYERFEFQERQSKHIVNGQRNYDFLGLNWALPLWDRALVDFWRDIPPEHKFGQRLYRRYLEAWNFKSLFRDFHPVVWQWPGVMKAALPLFRLVRLTMGTAARDRLLRSLLYFGMYRHHYAPFGYRYFLRNAHDLRNPISVFSRHWLKEMGISVRAV